MSPFSRNDRIRAIKYRPKKATLLELFVTRSPAAGLPTFPLLPYVPQTASHLAASQQRFLQRSEPEPSNPVTTSLPRISSFSARVVTSPNSANYWVPYDGIISRRTTVIHSYRPRVCSGIHPLGRCQKFLMLSAEKRLSTVSTNRYCSNCLAHEHSQGKCRKGDRCKTCNQNHHTLLPGSPVPATRSQHRITPGS
ncbi:hypothetical protein KR038_007898 [Drosophila bunnanda]|nr:hypothetical protein KR038_007898 [Drosophila bunnanda]